MDIGNNATSRYAAIADRVHELKAPDGLTTDIYASNDDDYIIIVYYEAEFVRMNEEERVAAAEFIADIRNFIAESGIPVTTMLVQGAPE